jgi:cytoskeletal protein RodZ
MLDMMHQRGIDMDPGIELRQAREAKQLTIEAVSRTTRIRPRLLAALERSDLSGIPPGPFARGFVRAYASVVGLDPQKTVHEYFARFERETHLPAPGASHFISPDGDTPSPLSWTWPLAALVGIAIIAFSVLGGDDRPAPVQAEVNPIGTSGQTSAHTTAPPPPTPVNTPIPSSVPATPGVRVVLTTAGPSWVEATADGEVVLYKLLQGGERRELHAERDLRLHIGDAGAVSLTINGRAAGVLGGPGEVRTLTITPKSTSVNP